MIILFIINRRQDNDIELAGILQPLLIVGKGEITDVQSGFIFLKPVGLPFTILVRNEES